MKILIKIFDVIWRRATQQVILGSSRSLTETEVKQLKVCLVGKFIFYRKLFKIILLFNCFICSLFNCFIYCVFPQDIILNF